MNSPRASVTILVKLTAKQADGLSQLVKRANRRNLGREGLDLVTPEEEAGAEAGLIRLAQALADAGYDPR